MAAAPHPGRPGLMRVMNDRAALSYLIGHGPLTRQQIGEATGLSGPTTTQVVRRLSDTGLVHVAGCVAGSRGPTATTYRARIEAVLGVALDVHPGSASARVVDASGQSYPMADVRFSGSRRQASSDLGRAIDAACVASGKSRADISAVCVGLPGAVVADTDQLKYADDLPGWPRHGVRTQLGEQLGVEMLIENDANLAAIAEAAAAGLTDFALLWLGDGLGVASVSDGRLRRGAAGEIGYLPVSVSASVLDPAALTLQDLAGGAAVSRLVKQHIPAVGRYRAALQQIETSASRSALLDALAPRIAEVLAPAIAVLDPAVVVLGGPTGAAGGAAGAAAVQSYLRHGTPWGTPVVSTVVPGNPVLRGAELHLAEHLRAALLERVT